MLNKCSNNILRWLKLSTIMSFSRDWWRWFHSSGNHIPKQGWPAKRSGGCRPISIGFLCLLCLRIRRVPRHPPCPSAAPILQNVLHLRHNRLHIRQRGRGIPKLHHLRKKAPLGPSQRDHGPRQDRPISKHRHFDPRFPGHGCTRLCPGVSLLQYVLGAAVAKVF